MSNHFHLLIEEPDREIVQDLDAATILKRIGFLYDSGAVRTVREELARANDAKIPDGKKKSSTAIGAGWAIWRVL